MFLTYKLYSVSLDALPDKQLLINTLNAHSYNEACKDPVFAEALQKSDMLIPDGVSVVWAVKLLSAIRGKQQAVSSLKKIAGEDLFYWEMRRLEARGMRQAVSSHVNGMSAMLPKAFFLGSTGDTGRNKGKGRSGW